MKRCKFRMRSGIHNKDGTVNIQVCLRVHKMHTKVTENELCEFKYMEVIFCKKREVVE